MPTVISQSPEETRALGRQWAEVLPVGSIIGLVGDLGAGKTQLVKGLAEGLGVAERIHSPTFTLVNVYSSGRWPVFHLDLYRLDTPEQIEAAGLLEYFSKKDAITVIEWYDRWRATGSPNPGQPFRWVQMETVQENVRRIHYEDSGF